MILKLREEKTPTLMLMVPVPDYRGGHVGGGIGRYRWWVIFSLFQSIFGVVSTVL